MAAGVSSSRWTTLAGHVVTAGVLRRMQQDTVAAA
jgi:hypothetical protein